MTKQELFAYIKRQLGAPVTTIEIAQEQLEDVVNDALDLFREFHDDAVKLSWKFLDVQSGVSEYNMAADVFSVVDVFGTGNAYIFNFDGEELIMMSRGLYSASSDYASDFMVSDIEVARQRYQMFRKAIRKDYVFDYSHLEQKIRFIVEPKINERIALLCNCYMTSSDSNFSSRWFKRYCVALAGILVGQSRGKYIGANLPGGASFNFSDFLERYTKEKEKLEQEVIDRYSTPLPIGTF